MYKIYVYLGLTNPYPMTINPIGANIDTTVIRGLSVNNPNTIRNNPMHSIRLTNAVAGNVFLFNRVSIL